MLDNIKLVNRLSFLVLILAITLLVVSFSYYALNSWFKINKIVVRGSVSNLTYNDLTYTIKNKLRGGFFTLNIDVIKREFEKIPWVKKVHVERLFPDTINVDIVENKAVANLGNGRLLSEEALIFNGNDKNSELPIFTVPNNKVSNALTAYKDSEMFMGKHELKLKSLVYSVGGVVKLGLSNGMTITICNDISKELVKLDMYWNQLQQIESNIISINMCYKDALAIK